MINFSLEGKIAVITGASRGIGEATAITLADHGAYCILASRKAEGLNKVAEKITKAGGKAEVIPCHTGYKDQIQELFKTVESKHGKLDILINNAATNPHFGPLETAEESMWDKIMDVNLKGPFLMIQEAVKLMEKAGSGSIVNVSSVAGASPGVFQGIYSISKAGVISMTKAFAKELAPKNIRVNALLPGLTETKLAGALFDNKDIYNIAMDMIPMKRHAQPMEMAGSILYLVTDAASSFTTGLCLVCDGGMIA